MRALEPGDGVVVPAEHDAVVARSSRSGASSGLLRVRVHEAFVRLEPGSPRVGLTAPLELVDPIPHAARHCAPNVSAGRAGVLLAADPTACVAATTRSAPP